MLMMRSALYNVAFYINLVGWMLIALPSLALPRRLFMRVIQRWAKASLWLLKVITGTDARWVGLGRLPPGGCILTEGPERCTWTIGSSSAAPARGF